MPVTVHVREKKKWRKYPCTVRNNSFIQFKDAKVPLIISFVDKKANYKTVIHLLCVVLLLQCHNEYFKVAVSDLDIFAGIERNKIDVKNPMPTR